MINGNTRQNEQNYMYKRRNENKICKLFITLKQRNFYQEVNSTRKGFKPQTLLITNRQGKKQTKQQKSSPAKVV